MKKNICFIIIILSLCAGQNLFAKASEKIDLNDLRFESSKDGEKIKALHQCFVERTKDKTWVHVPFRKLGNFVEELWCRGKGCDASGVSGVAMDYEPGVWWFELGTLHYEKDWPGVFGINVSMGDHPQEGEWGVNFYYSARGKSVLGEGLDVTFIRSKDGNVIQKISAGDSYAYDAAATKVVFNPKGGDDTELKRMLNSPEDLRDTIVASYNSVLKKTEDMVRKHKVIKEIEGEYKGNGIPPERTSVPLTAQEEKKVIEKARKDIGEICDSVRSNYKIFYKLLTGMIPFDKCWK